MLKHTNISFISTFQKSRDSMFYNFC